MTDQEKATLLLQTAYDTATLGLLSQGKPSLSPRTNMCVFRSHYGKGTDDGTPELKCALGFLIPDSAYDPRMDNHNPDNIPDDGRVWGVLDIIGVTPWADLIVLHQRNEHGEVVPPEQEHKTNSFFFSLQGVHDCADREDNDQWLREVRAGLRNLAHEYKLSTAVLDDWEASH